MGENEFKLPGGEIVSLRAVAPEDEPFLLRVYASTRADELAQVPWSDAQKEAFVRMQFDAQRRDYESRYSGVEYDVISLDGEPVGRIWISRTEAEIGLLDIALLPAAQNRGVGGALLRRLIEEARETGKPLRHTVFVYNNNALRFYERLGFRVTGDMGAYQQMEWREGEGGGEGAATPGS